MTARSPARRSNVKINRLAAGAAILIAFAASTRAAAQGQPQNPPAGQPLAQPAARGPAQPGQAPSSQGAPGQGAAGRFAHGGLHHGVAVIDIGYVFDNYSRFKQLTEQFKRDVEAADATLKKERDSIAKRTEQLKLLKPGTAEYRDKEEQITKAESDFKLKVRAAAKRLRRTRSEELLDRISGRLRAGEELLGAQRPVAGVCNSAARRSIKTIRVRFKTRSSNSSCTRTASTSRR